MSLDSSYSLLSAPGLRKSQKITGELSSKRSSLLQDTCAQFNDSPYGQDKARCIEEDRDLKEIPA